MANAIGRADHRIGLTQGFAPVDGGPPQVGYRRLGPGLGEALTQRAWRRSRVCWTASEIGLLPYQWETTVTWVS